MPIYKLKHWIKKRNSTGTGVVKKKSPIFSIPTRSLPQGTKPAPKVKPPPKAKAVAKVKPPPKAKAVVKVKPPPKTKATVKKPPSMTRKNCNQRNPKAEDPEYVCNPDTGRWVKRSGVAGKAAIKKYKL